MAKRPNPKELLDYVNKQEREKLKGKLKIFLGAAPGVGKTYAMLTDAINVHHEGIDVIAGIVETHGRSEIEALLAQFEMLPRHQVDYRGKQLEEFDLDAALKRRPDLILVDEMAHTNAPGSRHNKRWQDVFELLDRGISVYTTLNVQHIESQNDIVAQILGIVVRETIPDTVLERANSIELIDLPPDDLIKRLKEGKVYVPADIGLGLEHFFRKSNLTALRELALRIMAEQVDTELLLHRQGEAIEKIWPTKDRLLVCIGPNAHADTLIRATYRMAKNLHAEWIALSIETPILSRSTEAREKIIQHLRLAEQLGGEGIMLHGINVADEIIEFAGGRHVTRIIVGKKIISRWKNLFSLRLADELVRRSPNTDLFILKESADLDKTFAIVQQTHRTPKISYLISIATVALCTGLNLLLFDHLTVSTLIMFYFAGILAISTQGYFKPAFLASVLSVLSFDFFLISPRYSFDIQDLQSLIMLIIMFALSLLMIQLTLFNREKAHFSREREQRTFTMHLFSKELAKTRGVDNLLNIAKRHISDVFQCETIILLPDHSGQLIPVIGDNVGPALSTKEESVAQWVYDLGQVAGHGTQTLPDSEALYVPLLGANGSVGVLCMQPKDGNQILTPGQLHLLEGFCNQIAMALEVDRLEVEAKDSETQLEIDRVRNALMKYISDNMYSPLASIMDRASLLVDVGYRVNAEPIQALGSDIYNHAEDLTHSINKLSQIARLEMTDTLTKELNVLEDVIHAALRSLGKRLGEKPIHIHLSSDFPAILFNKVFLEEVFFNIIENAIKFTPPQSAMDISAALETQWVIINIEDRGPGIRLEEINRIFEKFYIGQAITHIKGMGLGLAICKRIVNLHGGEIWAENRTEGGAIFRFTLPR